MRAGVLFISSLLLFFCVLIFDYSARGIVTPYENPLTDTLQARIELGKRLFYDPILSRDSSISCSSCHLQELAFTDGKKTSVGIRGRIVSRNSPTLTNIKDKNTFLLDGVNPSLESQVRVPIQEHNEFDFHMYLILDRINRNPFYVNLARIAYDRKFDEYVLVHSIAEFERTLISDNSPYDQYLRGNKKALSKSQKRGMKIFFDKLYCSECHNGPNFSNDGLANNGLYEVYKDTGRMRLTEKEIDRAIFKVPFLRNIEVTAPYMHDGSFSSLEEVIDHYASGGKSHPNKSPIIQPFELSIQEKEDLVNFLKSLTDQDFLTNPAYRIIE